MKRFLTSSLGLSLMLAALLGCQSASQPAPEPLPPVDPASLYPLLDEASAALERGHYSQPKPGSALALYEQVLELDPQNAEALRGIEKVVELMVGAAADAARDWQLPRARSLIERARQINPDHPSIAPTQKQIELLSSANQEVVYIEQREVGTSGLNRRLEQLGRTAKREDCRARIRAGSDVQGRSIYQRMNSASGESRVRATMEVGLPARVVLVCFPNSAR